MRYLIDTSCCVHLLNGNPVLAMKVAEIGVYSFAIPNTRSKVRCAGNATRGENLFVMDLEIVAGLTAGYEI